MRSQVPLRRGFTLIEATLATTIAAIAGTALLQGVYGSLETTKAAQQQLIAAGLAQQMMDEIAGKMYCAVRNQPYETTLGPSSAEQAGPGRSQYNDIDDYNGIRNTPPADPWGIPIGNDDGQGGTRYSSMRDASFLSSWRCEVDVYYVSATDLQTKLSASQTSDYRIVEVRLYVTDPNGASRNLVTLKRVFAYVPTI
ncbi:MAG TPA: type II secretion system protein [Pirellulales bacterium]|jgi:type II secretory pathway pseudopilin PulG|nr:type II secretion system protein [Pirellulales bacterium]